MIDSLERPHGRTRGVATPGPPRATPPLRNGRLAEDAALEPARGGKQEAGSAPVPDDTLRPHRLAQPDATGSLVGSRRVDGARV